MGFFSRNQMAHLVLRGTLKGHNGIVTSIATNSETPDVLISGSRDKTIISWNLNPENLQPEEAGVPKRSLVGHSHFVEDVVLSSDVAFVLSCSWDGTLRLWDLKTGETTKKFIGHSKDILSVAFSADNRQIVSGSRDRSLKLWNTLGECKGTIGEGKTNSHTEWVSCVRFSPNTANPLIVSCGWDKAVKVWNLKGFELKYDLYGHTGYLTPLLFLLMVQSVLPVVKTVMLWFGILMKEASCSLPAGGVINALEFSPSKYWLCAATDNSIRIWDLEAKQPVRDLTDFTPAASYGKRKPPCLLLHGVQMVVLCMLVMLITLSEFGK